MNWLSARPLRYALCLAITASLAMAAGENSPKSETPPPPSAAAGKAKAAAKKKDPAHKAPAPAKDPAPKAQQQSATQNSTSTPAPEREHESGEFVRRRADWFQHQRAYPFQHIPPGALQKAIQQRDLMKQQQQLSGSGPQPDSVVTFPGDALWHLTGPQPTDSVFGANGGAPTASGRITAIAIDPTDATGQTVYAGGAAGGVWKTTDGGSTWTPLTDNQPSLAVGSIAIDPNNHLTIYVGTGESNFNSDGYYGAGILKSTDGGVTWTQLGASTFAGAQSPDVGGAQIGAIAVQPGNSSIVLAAVNFFDGSDPSGGVYRSTDGGTTWTHPATAQGSAGTGVVFESTSVAGTTAVAYAALGDFEGVATNGIYKSTDSGNTWTKLAGGLPASNIGRITLGYAASTTGAGATVYAAIASTASNSGSTDELGLFKTTNGGTSWSQLTGSPSDFCTSQCFYDMAIGVSPTNANVVVIGGAAFTDNFTSLFGSTNGGTTWTGTGADDLSQGSTAVHPHVDTHAIVFTPSGATSRLYVGNDGGMWRTDSPNPAAGGPSPLWVDLNATLATLQFYPGVSMSISDDNYGIGGTQDNDTELFTGTLDWTTTGACGDGAYTAIDTQIPTTFYTSCAIGSSSNLVFKSVFYGAVIGGNSTFNGADSGIDPTDPSQFIPPLAIASGSPSTLYYGTCRIYQTNDSANTWNPITFDLAGNNTPPVPPNPVCGGAGNISAIDAANHTGPIVFAGTSNGKVWRTLNANLGAASTWTEIDGGLLPARFVTSLRAPNGDSTGNILIASFSGFGSCAGCDGKGHVYGTTNGGAAWSNLSGNLPDTPVNDMVVIKTASGVHALLIGTDVGVFECPNVDSTVCPNWTVVGDGLPNSPVLALTGRNSDILEAATHGRSMWNIQLTNVAPPTLASIISMTPAAVMVGASTTNVTVTGANFSTNTVVLFDGVSVGTPTFVNTTQLTVSVNSSLFTDGHVFNVTLSDPVGTDGSSLPFAVMNPILNAVTMLPGTTTTYTPVTLTFTGSSFVPGTVVTFNGVQLTGGMVTGGGTGFQVPVPVSLLTVAIPATVTITNPLPGGGPTPATSFPFTITANPNALAIVNPSPIILGPIPLNTTTPVTNVTITNPGGAALTMTSVSITGANAANFAFATPTSGTSCGFPTSGQSGPVTGPALPAGTGTCNFGITYTAGTPPGPAVSMATLSITDSGQGSPQQIAIEGIPNIPLVAISPLNFGPIAIGTTSATMNSTLINSTNSVLTVDSTGVTISGANKGDFQLVPAAAGGNTPCAGTASFMVAANSQCDIGVTFTPSVAGNEAAQINVSDNGPGSPQSAPLLGVGVELTSISPQIVVTGGPDVILTVNGGGFAPSAVVNVNGSPRITWFISATQLMADLPPSDIATAGSLAITVTSPSPGGTTSEPKTLFVAQAQPATNDSIKFPFTVSAPPARGNMDTTQATENTSGIMDPTPTCGGGSIARSVWFKYVAAASGRLVVSTAESTYTTIISAWTGTVGSPLTAVANSCVNGNVAASAPFPAGSLVGFAVTSGTTYYIMVTDQNASGAGGNLHFVIDFASAAPANDDNATPTAITPAQVPYTNTVNSILATANTNGHPDATLPAGCATGAANNGQSNSVWYTFTPTNNGTITANTLGSRYATILNVTSGSPTGTQVACNQSAAAGIHRSQVSFAATSGTTYFFMVSAFLGEGGTTTFYLNFTATGVVGPPAKLGFTVQPSNVAAGASITPAVQVAVQDASGNTVTTATNMVTLAIGTNPASGTLSGTTTVAAVNGIATFSNLSINNVGVGYTLAASATSLTGATSSAFNVTAGTATKLAFTVQPSNTTAGSSITPAVQVAVQDAQGNTVTSATNMITVAIGTNPGSGTLSGTLTVAAVNGVASFSTLSINKAGIGYTLTASATSLTGATSSAFNITAGAANKLAFSVQPSNTTAGASITPAVQVAVQDAQGNTVTSATNMITVAIGTNPGSGTLSGTLTVAAVNGIASFSTLSINKAGTGYTLTASATSLTGATSSAFNITTGAANKLAFTVQPSNTTAGSSITPAVQVAVQDAQGNTVTSATNMITVAIGTNPSSGTLSGTATVAAVNGIATFSNLSINKTGTGYTLTASATSLTGATSSAFNITAGAANKLAFSVQPSNVGAGAPITPAVQVAVQDSLGNTVTTATNMITVAIGTNPGSGTLSGTTTVAAVNGVATFSNLSINNAGNGYTLTASATSLTGATSTAFNVSSGVAAKLTFTVQPSNVTAGASISPAVQIAVQDSQGNTITTATNMITVAIGTNPSSGTLSGTLTVAAVNGIATFATLNINKAGTGYTLTASATGLTGSTSSAFNVTAGAASKLAFAVQPSNTTAGASITPAVQVAVQDAQGNTVTSATNMITVAIGTNPSSGTLSGTLTVAAVSGVASFSTLSINKAGTGYTLTASATSLTGSTSSAFNITAGAASKLAFAVQPSNTAAGASITPAVQVAVQDAQGNTVTSATNMITVAIGTNPSSGTLSGTATVAAVNGIATFSNLSINKTGTGYTLTASATSLTGATSSAFNITPGAAAQLSFAVQPSNTAAGASITPAVQVAVQDAQGNTVTSATNMVTVAIGTNPGSGTLSGTLTVAAVNGIASFSTLSINKAGTGYTLTASATSLTGATSSAFNITPGAANKLAFSVQPSNTTAGASITPAVQVAVQDAQGNTVTSATNMITVAIGTNPSSGTLSGTTTVAAVNGVASFSTLSINKVGTGYTLTASATSLTGATSSAFNITAGAANKLAFSVQPSNTAAGASITPAVQVAVQDAQGNTVTSATNMITVAIGTNPSSGTLSGTATVAAVNGIATFSNLRINKTGTGYTLTASATSLAGATSSAFNITPGAANKLTFTVQPTNATAGASIAPALQVTVQDAQGNTVTSATNMITIGIGTNPGTGALSGTTTVAAVNGVATFSNLSINLSGSGYTLVASATGLSSATSTAFTISSASAAKLVFTVQPSSAGAGSTIAPAVQVSVEDTFGNVVTTAANSITLAIATNPSGGTLSGTTTNAAVNGVATFNNLSIDKAGNGYTLSATATGLTSGASSAFNITSGTAAMLAFTVQPSNVGSGASITPAVKVTVEDAQGNPVTTATNMVTIAISNNPASGTLSGTTTVAAVNGVATFSNLSINNLGVGYTLMATASGLASATSTAFNVTAGAPAKLAFTVQPTNAVSGVAIAPGVQVSVEDAGGNVVTSAGNMITIAIGTNPSSGTLSGTLTVAAVNGVATFSTLSINKAGTGYTLAASATGLTGATSTAFNITAGAAAKLAFSVQPSNVVSATAISPAIQVTVEDASGNTVTTAINMITVAISTNPSSGTLSGTLTVAAVNGVASFSTLSIDKAGTGYTLAASATGLTGATSTAFNVTAGAASKLVFNVQPSNVASGASITPAVQVAVEDAQGNTVTTATNMITVALSANPSSGTLSGTLTVAAVNGIATFSNLSIDKLGIGYSLLATATGLTSATSTTFNVASGPASKLAFNVQPSNVASGAAITPAVQVTIQDAQGNTVSTATNMVTIAIGTNPASGTLSGTLTIGAVNGIATFSTLKINKAGTGYTLSASATNLTGATSTAFNVTAGAAATVTATSGTPQVAVTGSAFGAPLVATVTDANSNLVSGVLVTFTPPAAGASGTFAGGVNTAMTNASGVATSGTFTANGTAGGPYNVVAGTLGAASANFSLTNNNPMPVITPPLSPASVTAGGTSFILTINGSGFVSGATVNFGSDNGLVPTSTTAGQIHVTIPAADIATAGTPNVVVNNPAPAVGPSAAQAFTVNNPVPTITAATSGGHNHAPGGAAITLTVTGTNFVSGGNEASVVNFNGKAETTTFVSATQLTANVPAADASNAGNFNVNVMNPAPGGGTTATSIAFTVDGYTIAGPANAVAVKAGQTAVIPIMVMPTANGFANSVTVSVSGLPAHATAMSVNVTPGNTTQTVNLMIMTKSNGAVPPSSPVDPPAPMLRILFSLWLAAMLAGLYAALLLRRTPQLRRYTAIVPIALLLLTGALIVGCASANGTPRGNSPLTVTATSGTLSQTTMVTLTVN